MSVEFEEEQLQDNQLMRYNYNQPQQQSRMYYLLAKIGIKNEKYANSIGLLLCIVFIALSIILFFISRNTGTKENFVQKYGSVDQRPFTSIHDSSPK